LLLLFLAAAEQKIEQAFGGCHARRQRNRRCECRSGDKYRAAPHG
jgi:hypothetical protein